MKDIRKAYKALSARNIPFTENIEEVVKSNLERELRNIEAFVKEGEVEVKTMVVSFYFNSGRIVTVYTNFNRRSTIETISRTTINKIKMEDFEDEETSVDIEIFIDSK